MKRILVANDLSPKSVNALGRAVRLAARTGARLCVLHATRPSDDPEHCPAIHRRILTEAQIMAEELTEVPIEITARISGHSPARAIVVEADRIGADLIILGEHGSTRFRDALFGTTGSHVVRHGRRRVLVVQNDHGAPYGKALIAMPDGPAAELVQAALDVAPNAQLHAVHAFSPTLGESLAGSRALDLIETQREHALEGELTQVGERHGRKELGKLHATVRTGDPLSIIMKETEKLKPDLLVMGTRRRVAFLGSHAVDTLFWCPNDVLVVPESAGAEE